MLSGNFNYNPGMLPINYDYNPMMMGQMNNCMNSANEAADNSNKMEKNKFPVDMILNFIFDGHKIAVHGNPNMTIERLIKNFRVKLCIYDFSGDYFFKGIKIDKDSTQTLIQSGISNEEEIYVFDQNDENQKEKLSKMLSHKHDNITIVFDSSTGTKMQISFSYYTKISKAFKLYCKKIGVGKAAIGNQIIFLLNSKKINIDDNRTIEEISCGNNTIRITVFDQGNILGG